MTGNVADDYEEIAKRLKEIREEKEKLHGPVHGSDAPKPQGGTSWKEYNTPAPAPTPPAEQDSTYWGLCADEPPLRLVRREASPLPPKAGEWTPYEAYVAGRMFKQGHRDIWAEVSRDHG